MDRLSAVVALAVAVAVTCAGCAGCNGGGGSASTGSRERVNAVKAEAPAAADTAAMCDRDYPGASAPTFEWPALTTKPPVARAGAWRWINVWATWCKPCIEEMPRLVSWRKQLAESGVDVDLILVSADATDDEVAAFRAAHPSTPASARLADPDAAAPWISSLGVQGATLPVHVFVDPAGKVRCVRASAIEASDFPAVKALLR